ncbi:MAG: TIGR03619 family F420-dependent LLM class oxidoreductase [Acidimicrobiales bacterium]
MRFAIQHAIGDPAWSPATIAPANVRAWCEAAETHGWDAIGFTDHPAPTAPWIDSGGEGVADPIASLAFCAAVTSRIRLLTFVLVPAYRNPFLAAHQLATLDRLSGGRLTIGLGTGYLFGEFRALGADPGTRREAFDRAVDIMRRAWGGEEVTADDGRFAAKRVRGLPPVVQRPHPPLWVHGNSPFGVDRAGRYAQGWLGMMTTGSEVMARTTRTRPLPDLQTLARRIGEVRKAAHSAGRDPEDVEIIVAGAWPMLDVRTRRPADTYRAEIAALEGLGVDWTVSLCCGDDPGVARETVEAFGDEVIGPCGRC